MVARKCAPDVNKLSPFLIAIVFTNADFGSFGFVRIGRLKSGNTCQTLMSVYFLQDGV